MDAAVLMLKGFWAGIWLFLSMWQIWGALVVFAFITSLPQLYHRWRLGQAGMPEIDEMDGIEFERYLEIMFQKLGYHVRRTPPQGDQGADLILTGNGESIAVQAKRWNKRVGNKAVQEIYTAVPHYGCERGMVVSNQEYTRAAQELAESCGVELWGRSKLADVILSLQRQKQGAAPLQAPSRTSAASSAAPAVEPTPIIGQAPKAVAAPTCERCGKPMVLRDGPRGKFWGCSGFPKCRNTKPS